MFNTESWGLSKIQLSPKPSYGSFQLEYPVITAELSSYWLLVPWCLELVIVLK